MAIDILSNCHFDLTRIKKLYIGSTLLAGGQIVFPINYVTLSGSSDSIITYYSSDMQTIIIGGQTIVMDEVFCVEDNITFNEELIIDNRSKNYIKTITYEIPGIDLALVDKTEENTIDEKSSLLAILIDENLNELIVGYDNPLGLESISSVIDVDNNNILVTLVTTSISRARNTQNTLVVPQPSISLSPSRTPSVTRTLTPTPSITRTPTRTPSITRTPTVTPSITITPSETPSITITPSETPSITITPSETPSITPTPTPSA